MQNKMYPVTIYQELQNSPNSCKHYKNAHKVINDLYPIAINDYLIYNTV